MFVGDAFNAEERTVVAGYDNGDIKMFDLKKMAVRWETNIKNGVLSLILFDIYCLVINYYIKHAVFHTRKPHGRKCVSEPSFLHTNIELSR